MTGVSLIRSSKSLGQMPQHGSLVDVSSRQLAAVAAAGLT